ncbi:MAG: LCP family protein required for cell wall assembly [Glaciecola sp.]|jgi:LCP family protein required for cell wall assembly
MINVRDRHVRKSRHSMFSAARPSRGASLRAWVKYGMIGLVVLGVLGLLSGLYLLRYASSNIPSQEIQALQDRPTVTGDDGEQVSLDTGGLDVLVVGLDTREALTPEQLSELGTQDVGSSLTDTVLLVQVHPDREKAVVVSFPRDLKVEVPGKGEHKINAVHGLGGPNLLVQVIEDYTGIQIDHYAEVSLAGMLDVVDRVGGTEVCLQEPMIDAYAGVNLPAGCQVLSGAQAAGFVRSRRVADEFGPADDFGRIARQQYFIGQLMSQVTSAGTLFNPLKLRSLIGAVSDAVLVDDELGPGDLLSLGRSLSDLAPTSVDFRVIPSYWSAQTGYVHAYPEETAALMQSLQDGEALPENLGQSAPVDLLPGDVRIMVLNGEGSEGLASLVAQRLTDDGFVVTGTDNNSSFDVQRTQIRTTSADEPRARLLAALLPNAEVILVPRLAFANVHVVLVVGADRAGLPEDPADGDGG